jgi:hypothetical protein
MRACKDSAVERGSLRNEAFVRYRNVFLRRLTPLSVFSRLFGHAKDGRKRFSRNFERPERAYRKAEIAGLPVISCSEPLFFEGENDGIQ